MVSGARSGLGPDSGGWGRPPRSSLPGDLGQAGALTPAEVHV